MQAQGKERTHEAARAQVPLKVKLGVSVARQAEVQAELVSSRHGHEVHLKLARQLSPTPSQDVGRKVKYRKSELILGDVI
jgi:hypothetical protein